MGPHMSDFLSKLRLLSQICCSLLIFGATAKALTGYVLLQIHLVRAALMTLLLNLQITTGYNLEDDRCECVALQDYKENEQVTRSSLWSLCLMSMYTRNPQI